MLQSTARLLQSDGEIIETQALGDLVPAWDDLCSRSVEPNAYYSPRYAQALLNTVERGAGVLIALAWDGPRLIGFLPFVKSKLSLPIIGPVGHAWQSKYTFSCMPLLDRDRPVDAAVALFDTMASFADEWIIPVVNTQGLACRSMMQALANLGRSGVFFNRFQRASLDVGVNYDAHMMSSVPSKRRRDLARTRRRLEELGKVTHESHQAGAGLGCAIEAFLRIEAGGWKGRQNTALACADETKQFAIAAFIGNHPGLLCRADVLKLDNEPIAVGITIVTGRTGFTVKCAYDEAYSKYSAGLQLEVEVMRSFLSERWADRLDAATEDAHVIDSLWPGRMEVADLIFSLSARSPEWRIAAIQNVKNLKRTSKRALRGMLARLTD